MDNSDPGAARSSRYRQPPKTHQFKKGQSGNPKGRPKKAKTLEPGATTAAILDRIQQWALEEASRTITVREGDEVVELPAMKAVLRNMYRQAARGDAKTQRHLLELASSAEKSRITSNMSILEAALAYKHDAEAEDAQYRLEGRTPPPRYPDPGDVLINHFTGNVTIDGPVSREQAEAMAAIEAMMPDKLRRMFEVEEALSKYPRDKALREEQQHLGVFLDYLERMTPRRFRRLAEQKGKDAMERAESKAKSQKNKTRISND